MGLRQENVNDYQTANQVQPRAGTNFRRNSVERYRQQVAVGEGRGPDETNRNHPQQGDRAHFRVERRRRNFYTKIRLRLHRPDYAENHAERAVPSRTVFRIHVSWDKLRRR